MSSLQRIEGDIKGLQDRQMTIREDIAGLKIKSGVWGVIGGCIPIVIVLMMMVVSKAFN